MHHALNLPLRLWHRTSQLLRIDLAEALERLLLAIQDRIAALHQLDKLSCVDIRIAPAVDIVQDLGRQLDAGDRAVGRGCESAERGEGVCEVGSTASSRRAASVDWTIVGS